MRRHELNALVGSTSDPSFAVDESGCIAAMNAATAELFALPAGEAIGRLCHEIVNGTDEFGNVCSSACALRQAVDKGLPVSNFDLQVETAQGTQWCDVSVLVAQGENMNSRYAVHIARPNDFRKRLELLVRELVVHEFATPNLTGSRPRMDRPTCAGRISGGESPLSTREREVLRLLAKGETTKTVGEQLHISHTTVNNHVQHVLRKLGAHTRMEAIRRAERARWI